MEVVVAEGFEGAVSDGFEKGRECKAAGRVQEGLVKRAEGFP